MSSELMRCRSSLPTWHNSPYQNRCSFRPGQGRASFFGFAQLPDHSSVADLLRLARETQAQVIVRDYSEFTGWAVARRLGLPLVTQAIIHRLPPPAEARVVELAARLAGLAGIDPPADADALLGSAYLDVVPPSFRCPWEHGVALARSARPSAFDGASGETPPPWLDRLGRARPLVYVTLGTIFTASPAMWRVLLDTLSGLDVDALVTTGSGPDPLGLGALPPHVRVERYVPQSLLLPRCRAVVCHAGFNTLIGAFRHGLPALCLPLDADQPVNAIRCAAAGAGINAANAPARDPRGPLVDPATLDADQVATALLRLLNEPAFTQAAARLANEIQAMPGPAHTADLLEQLSAADESAAPRTA